MTRTVPRSAATLPPVALTPEQAAAIAVALAAQPDGPYAAEGRGRAREGARRPRARPPAPRGAAGEHACSVRAEAGRAAGGAGGGRAGADAAPGARPALPRRQGRGQPARGRAAAARPRAADREYLVAWCRERQARALVPAGPHRERRAHHRGRPAARPRPRSALPRPHRSGGLQHPTPPRRAGALRGRQPPSSGPGWSCSPGGAPPRFVGVTTAPAPIRLTQYAHGGGCACKIPPGELEAVVAGLTAHRPDRPRTPSWSSAWTTATTRRWSASPAARAWCSPPTSSPPWSTTRTPSAGSPRPTRCPTSTRWAAPRSSRSTCSAGRATCCPPSSPPRCCAAGSRWPRRPAATSAAGTRSTTRSPSTAWRSPGWSTSTGSSATTPRSPGRRCR